MINNRILRIGLFVVLLATLCVGTTINVQANDIADRDNTGDKVIDDKFITQLDAIAKDAKGSPIAFVMVNGNLSKVNKGDLIPTPKANAKGVTTVRAGIITDRNCAGGEITVGANENGEFVVKDISFKQSETLATKDWPYPPVEYRVALDAEVRGGSWPNWQYAQSEAGFDFWDDYAEVWGGHNQTPDYDTSWGWGLANGMYDHYFFPEDPSKYSLAQTTIATFEIEGGGYENGDWIETRAYAFVHPGVDYSWGDITFGSVFMMMGYDLRVSLDEYGPI